MVQLGPAGQCGRHWEQVRPTTEPIISSIDLHSFTLQSTTELIRDVEREENCVARLYEAGLVQDYGFVGADKSLHPDSTDRMGCSEYRLKPGSVSFAAFNHTSIHSFSVMGGEESVDAEARNQGLPTRPTKPFLQDPTIETTVDVCLPAAHSAAAVAVPPDVT